MIVMRILSKLLIFQRKHFNVNWTRSEQIFIKQNIRVEIDLLINEVQVIITLI